MTTKTIVNLTCPVRGCPRRRKPAQVMCREHWYAVPAELRARVWNAYHNARASSEHLSAIREAIESVSEQPTK